MRKFSQLLVEPGNLLVRNAARDLPGGAQICWYPSSGDDYRHVRFFESQWLKDEKSVPLVYLHTDVFLPNSEVHRDRPDQNLAPFRIGDELDVGLFVESATEISFKVPIASWSDDVLYHGNYDHLGRAFLVSLRLQAKMNGRPIFVPILLIHVVAENLTFLVRVLLNFGLRIHTLVHIRDGGASMGNSKIPMVFIYHVAERLGIKRILSDRSPQDQSSFYYEGQSALRRAIHEFEFDRERRGSNLQRSHLSENSVLSKLARSHKSKDEFIKDFVDQWVSNPIPRSEFAPNWAEPPNGYYKIWNRVNNPQRLR